MLLSDHCQSDPEPFTCGLFLGPASKTGHEIFTRMVARLQKCLVIGAFTFAFAWVIAWAWHTPWVAIMGVSLVLGGHSLVLGLEFIANFYVNGRDTAQRAGSRTYVRAWFAESWMALRVFCWYQPFRSRAIRDHLPTSTRRGAVLIHGFLCNRGFWNPWLNELMSADHAFIAVNLEPMLGSIDQYVQIIDEAILRVETATRQPPLLICHSMGGLAARAWLRGADPSRIHRIVTIGTPHGGTWLARFGRTVNARQMRMDADWLRQLEASSRSCRPPCPVTCWYSNCDNVVFPTSTATLPLADNRLISGRGHIELAFDKALMQATLALMAEK